MTCIIKTTSKRRLSAKLAAGIAISAVLAFGALTAPASAREHHDWDRGGGYYSGGYYRAPPVVYGSPYGSSYYGYAPGYSPPVVYGPGIGISLPGISIGIP